ncbi:HAD-IA family hydrolase [Novosphingobium sp.]|uniref:HAD-IA family hydrolase n=1 Tax=Novosphingobium sp. TaxID=1874826 RepID=UPI003341A4E9
MALRAIIFDVDGTLAETEQAHRRAFNQAFAEAGQPWHWSDRDYAALLTTTGGRERIARYRMELGLPADPAAVEALHRRKNALYAQSVAAGAIAPRPGVTRLMQACRDSRVTMAIATTTSRANLIALLDHTFAPGAAGWFAAMVTGEDVSAKKPDPAVYRQVLANLSLQPAACVAIEDSHAGLTAARACGIATVITRSHYTAAHDFTGAALVCDTLDDDGAGDPVTVARLATLAG